MKHRNLFTKLPTNCDGAQWRVLHSVAKLNDTNANACHFLFLAIGIYLVSFEILKENRWWTWWRDGGSVARLAVFSMKRALGAVESRDEKKSEKVFWKIKFLDSANSSRFNDVLQNVWWIKALLYNFFKLFMVIRLVVSARFTISWVRELGKVRKMCN